jgi:hypothetical protein
MYETQDQERRKNNSAQDEIDLITVFKGIGNFFKSIVAGILYLFKVLLKNIFIVGFIVSLGIAAGYFGYNNTKPYYKSSMTLVLADYRNQFVEDHLNKLTLMVQDDNFEAISERLKIPVEDAKQIKEMTFSNLDEARISEDSVLAGSPFRIELMLYNKDMFDNMEESITNYLENNRYFVKQKRIKQRQLESLVKKYKKDISSIDSVKTAAANLRGPANGFVYGEPLDPTNLYKESVNMYQHQVQLESELERIDILQVVVGFTPQSRPTWPVLPVFLAAGAFGGFLIALMVALIIENKKRRKFSL